MYNVTQILLIFHCYQFIFNSMSDIVMSLTSIHKQCIHQYHIFLSSIAIAHLALHIKFQICSSGQFSIEVFHKTRILSLTQNIFKFSSQNCSMLYICEIILFIVFHFNVFNIKNKLKAFVNVKPFSSYRYPE